MLLYLREHEVGFGSTQRATHSALELDLKVMAWIRLNHASHSTAEIACTLKEKKEKTVEHVYHSSLCRIAHHESW